MKVEGVERLKTKVKVKCPKCGHVFLTGTLLGAVSCNSCLGKFRKENNIIQPPTQKKLEIGAVQTKSPRRPNSQGSRNRGGG